MRQLSLTDALLFCFRINHILAEWKKTHEQKQKDLARLFFTKEESQRMFSSSPRIVSFNEIAITTRGPIMLLVQWASMFCEDQKGDGTTFNDPVVRQTFAKAMLIADHLWQQNIKMERMLDDVPIEEARYNLLSTFRQNSAGNHLPVQHGTISTARGVMMFIDPGYFPKRCSEFAEQFRTVAGMSVEDYYLCLTYIASNVLDNKVDGKAFFQRQQALETVPDDFRETFDKFLTLESQDATDIRHALWGDVQQTSIQCFDDAPPFNDRSLRARPFFRTQDGRIMLIDPVLYMDKMTDGPLFTLLQSDRNHFQEFGYAFEAFMHDYLQSLYPASALNDRLSCPLFREQKDEELADGCLDYGEEMILFEFKATFLNQEKIIGNDNEQYVAMLRERYVMTLDGEPKGVTQLANSITKLASGACRAADRDFSIVKKIYPVLLVHDELIDASMHPYFFANEFVKALMPDETFPSGYLRKGRFLIAPMTLMTVEDLENLEFPIRKRGFSLRDALEKYTVMYPDRRESFHNFCGDAGYQSYATQVFAETSLDMIKKTRERLFAKKAA